MSWHYFDGLEARRVLAFRYVDRQAGPSAKGAFLAGIDPTTGEVATAATRPEVTVRIDPRMQMTALSAADVARLGLPAEPEWMQFFKPGPWTSDPRLAGKFHPEYPDDLQASFFFPSTGNVEQMWVRLERAEPALEAYAGKLLNTAHADASIAAGTTVLIRPAPGASIPVWLSPAVQENLRDWTAKCSACGFDLVVEPVSALLARQFANAPPGATFEALTTRCAMCRNTQMVTRRGLADSVSVTAAAPAPVPAVRSRSIAVVVAVVLVLAALAWSFLR